MRTSPTALALLTAMLIGPGAAWALEAYTVAPIHKITPDEPPSPSWSQDGIDLDCARNEWEAFQVVLRSDEPIAEVGIMPAELRADNGAVIPVERFRVHRVEWVDVNAPYDPDEPSENPDFQPDPLPPVMPGEDRFAIEPGRNLIFWLIVGVPEDARPGVYAGRVQVISGATEAAAVDVRLRVRSFALPRRPILESMVGIAFPNAERAHGVKTREDREALARLYFEEYIRARLSPFLYAPGTMAFNPIPDGRIKWEFTLDAEGNPTGEATLDFEVFDREGEYYFDEREAFSAFNFAPYLWTRVREGDERRMVLRFTDVKGTTVERLDAEGAANPVFDELVVSVFRQIAAHLSAKGWLDRAIYYVTDEPPDSDTPALMELCRLIRRADPRIRTALTYDPANRPRLAELVEDGQSLISLWIPYCSMYREDVAAEQRARGAEYWLYDVKQTCLISHTGQQNRAMFWDVWRVDAKGYLYYLSTWWGRAATPWERPNFMLPEFTYRYHHGDGYFFYPPLREGEPEEPILDYVVPTIRWELMREGAEDYDYLRMLEDFTVQAQERGLEQAAQGAAALQAARALADSMSIAVQSYGIRDLEFTATEGWSFGLEEGWLHHRGQARSDLPISFSPALPDGQYELMLSAYDDRDYRGRPYSRFEVNGTPVATPGSAMKGATTVPAGTVQVRDGVCEFTLSSVEEEVGVILYRVSLKRLTQDAARDLYAVRAQVSDALDALHTALNP